MHVILKGALAQAVKWEMLVRNPTDAVDPPKASRASIQTSWAPIRQVRQQRARADEVTE